MSEAVTEAFEAHGALVEGVHLAGYSFARATKRLLWLLQEDRWRALGFDDVNAFMASISLGSLRPSIDERRELVRELVRIEAVSKRQIARTLGVADGTVRRDAAQHCAPRVETRAADLTVFDDAAQHCAPRVETRAAGLAGEDVARLAEREADAARRASRAEALRRDPVPPPPGRYATVVLDPPWPAEKIPRAVRPNQHGLDYPTMGLDEIAGLGVAEVLAGDAWLLVWTTHRFLPAALGLVDGWGARYRWLMTWHKPGGYQPVGSAQLNTEHVVVSSVGGPRLADPKAFPAGFDAPRGAHSEKPDAFYDLVGRCLPGPHLDMFARRNRDGWTAWGDEA